MSTLAYQAPYFALPVIVLVNVDAATNSSFYVAWGIVAIAFYVPSAIGQALLAEGGKDGAQVRSQMRLAHVAGRSGSWPSASVVAFLGKGLVIAAYGENYRDAAHILPAMMAAGIPWAITSLYLTEARVLHRNVVTVIITVTLTVSIIVPALILVPGEGKGHGLDGASTSWLHRQLHRRGDRHRRDLDQSTHARPRARRHRSRAPRRHAGQPGQPRSGLRARPTAPGRWRGRRRDERPRRRRRPRSCSGRSSRIRPPRTGSFVASSSAVVSGGWPVSAS